MRACFVIARKTRGDMCMEQKQKQRVMLLYKEMIPSVRLCGHYQLSCLAEQGKIDYRPRTLMQVSRADLNWADIVLMCRLDNAYELYLARALKKAGKRIVYVIDDDLLNVPRTLVSGAYYAQEETRACISALMEISDAILSPSPVLLDKYARGRQGILLEEPAIDPVPYTPRESGTPVKIGFAGSVDRTGDIEQILRESLLRIRDEYAERVKFVFFGAVPSFAAELKARCIPYCDSYDAYRDTLNGLKMDIGLAPMPDNDFYACKHYNKFIEYAAAGIVGVFSNVRPYDRIREKFGWPVMCGNTAEEWIGAIRQLLDHPEELDQLKRRIAQLAGGEFSISVIAENLMAALDAIPVQEKQTPVKVNVLPVRKVFAQIKRIVSGVKRYGRKAPAIIRRKIRNMLSK